MRWLGIYHFVSIYLVILSFLTGTVIAFKLFGSIAYPLSNISCQLSLLLELIFGESELVDRRPWMSCPEGLRVKCRHDAIQLLAVYLVEQ